MTIQEKIKDHWGTRFHYSGTSFIDVPRFQISHHMTVQEWIQTRIKYLHVYMYDALLQASTSFSAIVVIMMYYLYYMLLILITGFLFIFVLLFQRSPIYLFINVNGIKKYQWCLFYLLHSYFTHVVTYFDTLFNMWMIIIE